MYYGDILKADIANGLGIRLSLFVSGCTIHCKDCFNKKTWDFRYGHEFTKEVEDKLMFELGKVYYSGITILGGEPFEIENQPTIADLIERITKELPDKDIWVYTGNIYDNLLPGGKRYIQEITDKILDNIDVLVEGPFISELYDLKLNFRGSSNQRIIDMKKTRKEGRIILHTLNN